MLQWYNCYAVRKRIFNSESAQGTNIISTVDLAEIGNILELLLQLTQGESLVVRSGGEDVGVLVATQDTHLLEVIESYLDNQAADAALAEGAERIPYEVLRHELNLIYSS